MPWYVARLTSRLHTAKLSRPMTVPHCVLADKSYNTNTVFG